MSTDLEKRFTVRRLGQDDTGLMYELLHVFGEAFEQEVTYGSAQPDRNYLKDLLAGDCLVALTALIDGKVAGGLTAYVLPKCEQERSEIYIYDLAVAAPYRRQGIATALLQEIRKLAASRGAHVVFVQADRGDAPAISLYTKLGKHEDVLHFDLEPISN